MTIRLKIENLESPGVDDHDLKITLPNYNGEPIIVPPGQQEIIVLFGGGVIEVEEA